jgi:hypothetical protein
MYSPSSTATSPGHDLGQLAGGVDRAGGHDGAGDAPGPALLPIAMQDISQLWSGKLIDQL